MFLNYTIQPENVNKPLYVTLRQAFFQLSDGDGIKIFKSNQ